MQGSGSGAVAADCSPGSIVWVRRRNGSWWPGRILGTDELSDCHLTSPRAGTPVKLLGREDASIDWYNLERSKRVKAFRCGDFDDCIEKVETSQTAPAKKREKYASREDAILHALELEKELLRKQRTVDVGNQLNGTKTSERSFLVSSVLGNGSNNTMLSHVIRRSADDGIPNIASHSPKGKNDSCVDGLLENIPRMRGLQDFGLKIAAPKRKLSSSFAADGLLYPRMNCAPVLRVGNSSMENNYCTDDEEMGVFWRAKRSRCMYLDHSDSLDDRDNHQSIMDISPSTSCEGNPYPNTALGGGDGSSDYYLSESEPDSSETGKNTNEETTSLSENSDITGMRKAQEHGSMSSDEHERSPLSSDVCQLLPHDHISDSRAVSRWQLKGKRNIRNLPKRHVDAGDRNGLIASSHGMRPVKTGMMIRQRASSKWGSRVHLSESYGSINAADESQEYLEAQFIKSVKDHDCFTPRVTPAGFGSPRMIDWEDMSVGGASHDSYFIGQNPASGERRRVLFEVDLKVQTSHQRERVPIVAMMSKLNGNSIVGHSVQIEEVEDGSSHCLVPVNDNVAEESIYGNRRMALPAAWRTARRTANFRVPRLKTSSAFDGDEDAEGVSSVKSVGAEGAFGRKGFIHRRNFSQMSALQSDRKIPKLTKTVSLSSRQKIRTLSSIDVEKNFDKCIFDDGLIECGGLKPTTVACIPVKLVFSRLLEKINRPPLKGRLNADYRE